MSIKFNFFNWNSLKENIEYVYFDFNIVKRQLKKSCLYLISFIAFNREMNLLFINKLQIREK